MIEYEIFVQLLFFLLAFYKINKGKSVDSSHIACFFFAAYVITVFFITDVGTLTDGIKNGIVINELQFNLDPFSRHIYFPAYLANVLMFIPFGFLTSVIERRDVGIVRATAEGLVFSSIIELSQLLNTRYTDIDDLIVNTIGAIIGYLLYKVLFRCRCSKGGKPTFEALKYVFVMFLGHFLFFSETIYLKIFG